ncbi:MAG: reverse transcriptase family protein, partial [Cyanobacteria bacterium J06614_10]
DIKEEITKHEKKKTEEVKKGGKKLFDYIRILKGERTSKEELSIYNEEGIKLNKEEMITEVKKFWGDKIYNMHENKINEVWNEQIKETYEQEIQVSENEEDIYGNRFPREIREHIEAGVQIMERNRIKPMNKPDITEEKIKKCLKRLKKKKAPGPDGMKAELYKPLTESKKCIKTFTLCMQNEIKTKGKPKSWKRTNTKMLKKVKKPKVKELRPITLADISYKIFMSLIRYETEDHIEENEERIELQAGFTEGGRIEDNIFILQYCIEMTYRARKGLIVIAIDFQKAYDSIKRESLIEIMKEYKIHKDIIESVAELYQGDSTIIEIGEDFKEEMKITNGIKQGCTGSTTFFKLITYKIIKELRSKGEGYKDEIFNINSLFFADDGLLLAKNEETAREIIIAIMDIGERYGLKINKDKCNILIYNLKLDITEIEGIQIMDKIKYLGITIENKRNTFSAQKKIAIEKAEKMANMTYPIIAKSCNKILIGKTYWKQVALPSILFGSNIINYNETEINRLQRIENGVARKIL